jgi:hypothetical protein
MDMSVISMDTRGKQLFEFSEREMADKGGYDLIHPDDLQYYSAAHHELIKTGSAGLIAYRLMTKDLEWVWLQTSARVVYKNSKPEFVLATHRHLTEDEGRDLCRKRGSEFKLPYPIIDVNPTDFEPNILLTANDDNKLTVSNNNNNNKKSAKSRGTENKKRKSQSQKDSTGCQLVSRCSITPVVNEFKSEILHPGVRTFDTAADLYRNGVGYQSVLTTGSSLDPSGYSRYYLDGPSSEMTSYSSVYSTHTGEIPCYSVIRSKTDLENIYAVAAAAAAGNCPPRDDRLQRYSVDGARWSSTTAFDAATAGSMSSDRLEWTVGGLLDPSTWLSAPSTASWYRGGQVPASVDLYSDHSTASLSAYSISNYDMFSCRLPTPPDEDLVPTALSAPCQPTVLTFGAIAGPNPQQTLSTVTTTSCSSHLSFGVATPVIQTTARSRVLKSADLTNITSTSASTGIAVPVVKSSSVSSWLPAQSNCWSAETGQYSTTLLPNVATNEHRVVMSTNYQTSAGSRPISVGNQKVICYGESW